MVKPRGACLGLPTQSASPWQAAGSHRRASGVFRGGDLGLLEGSCARRAPLDNAVSAPRLPDPVGRILMSPLLGSSARMRRLPLQLCTQVWPRPNRGAREAGGGAPPQITMEDRVQHHLGGQRDEAALLRGAPDLRGREIGVVVGYGLLPEPARGFHWVCPGGVGSSEDRVGGSAIAAPKSLDPKFRAKAGATDFESDTSWRGRNSGR